MRKGGKSLDAYESAMSARSTRRSKSTVPGRVRRVGLINDDSTPVGQVHLGVVHLFELEQPRVLPREEGLAEAEFLPLSDRLSKSATSSKPGRRSASSHSWGLAEIGRRAERADGLRATAPMPGWRWSSQSIKGGKISRGACRLQTRSQWP